MTLALIPGEHGLSRALIHTIRTARPGYLVESDTIATGIFEHHETISFYDHHGGGTFVSIHYAVQHRAPH